MSCIRKRNVFLIVYLICMCQMMSLISFPFSKLFRYSCDYECTNAALSKRIAEFDQRKYDNAIGKIHKKCKETGSNRNDGYVISASSINQDDKMRILALEYELKLKAKDVEIKDKDLETKQSQIVAYQSRILELETELNGLKAALNQSKSSNALCFQTLFQLLSGTNSNGN